MTRPGTPRNRLHRVLAWTTYQLGGLLPGAKVRRLQVAAFEREWDAANAASLAALSARPGRLLVVLGDSTAQAIGASSRERGYALMVLDALRRTDPTWQLVNLSRTGARLADVLDEQLPAMARLPEPELVTVAIGVNDLRHRTAILATAMTTLIDALPSNAVVATIPQGLRPQAAHDLNALIRARATERGLSIADVWAHTGPPWQAKFSADHFHPNDLGYAGWAAAFRDALGLPAAPSPAAPSPAGSPVASPTEAPAPVDLQATRLDQLRCLGRRFGLLPRDEAAQPGPER